MARHGQEHDGRRRDAYYADRRDEISCGPWRALDNASQGARPFCGHPSAAKMDETLAITREGPRRSARNHEVQLASQRWNPTSSRVPAPAPGDRILALCRSTRCLISAPDTTRSVSLGHPRSAYADGSSVSRRCRASANPLCCSAGGNGMDSSRFHRDAPQASALRGARNARLRFVVTTCTQPGVPTVRVADWPAPVSCDRNVVLRCWPIKTPRTGVARVPWLASS